MTTKYQTRCGNYDAEIIDRLDNPERAVAKLTSREDGAQMVLLVYPETLKVLRSTVDHPLDLVPVPPPTLEVGKTYTASNGPNPYEIVAKRGDLFIGVRDSTIKNAPPVVDFFYSDGTFYVSPDLQLKIPD